MSVRPPISHTISRLSSKALFRSAPLIDNQPYTWKLELHPEMRISQGGTGATRGTCFHVEDSTNIGRETNRKQLGGLGLDQIFTINGLPSPGPKIGCKIPVLLQVGSPRLAGPSRGVPISRKWRVQKPSRRGRFYLDWQISLADQNRMQSRAGLGIFNYLRSRSP